MIITAPCPACHVIGQFIPEPRRGGRCQCNNCWQLFWPEQLTPADKPPKVADRVLVVHDVSMGEDPLSKAVGEWLSGPDAPKGTNYDVALAVKKRFREINGLHRALILVDKIRGRG